MERTGALFAVAAQAAAVEPLIAGFWQQGREQTRHVHGVFWTRMAADGLLDPGTDLDWLIDTTTLMSAAETYLLITRMLGWDLDTYQDWLATALTRLATAGGARAPVPRPRANRRSRRRASGPTASAVRSGRRDAGAGSAFLPVKPRPVRVAEAQHVLPVPDEQVGAVLRRRPPVR